MNVNESKEMSSSSLGASYCGVFYLPKNAKGWRVYRTVEANQ